MSVSIVAYGQARPMWYDRNPADKSITYFVQAQAPAADTQRASYTVPTGKKAVMSWGQVKVVRNAVAAPAGRVIAYIRLFATNIDFAAIIYTNVQGDKDGQFGAFTGVLQAGDQVEIRNADASTGGSVDYGESTELTEFDS